MEKSVFGFFVSSVGISAINPFSDFLFLSQKRIRVISCNNPILDFTKEMYPKELNQRPGEKFSGPLEETRCFKDKAEGEIAC